MNKIILTNGVAQSGKNTFQDFCKYYLERNLYKVITMSTIDKVKQFCYNTQGIPIKDKDDLARAIWSITKEKYSEFLFWDFCRSVDTTFDIYNRRSEYKGVVLYADCREKSEILKFKERYHENCITLLIRNTEAERRVALSTTSNKSDKNVLADLSIYDKVIHNDGDLKDLDNEAKEFCNCLVNMEGVIQ